MSDFKVLSDVGHCLQRPQMYIGSTSVETVNGFFNFEYQKKEIVPGLIKIINEILDNSADEYIRTKGQFANKISIDIANSVDGWFIRVSDNGRGIPAIQHDGIYQAELAWTKAKAGSNFNDDGRVTIGMNGVGSFCTNVFSTSFIGTSCDGKTSVTVSCADNLSTVETLAHSGKTKGTTVTFYPDLARFGLTEINEDHISVIYDRLNNLMMCYNLGSDWPELQVIFNGKKIPSLSPSKVAKSIHPDAICSHGDSNLIVIAPAGDEEEFRFHSYVNGLHMKSGGSHIDNLTSEIISELQPIIKKKWKIDVLPNQIRQHLMVAYWLSGFPNPKFDSQTKERLTNTPGEIKTLVKYDPRDLAKKILNTPSIIDPMVQAILHKKELAEAREAAALAKKTQKKKILNHIQATSKDVEAKSIHLTEGLSASGMIINVRNPEIHGSYSLRGKVMNTHGMKPVDILKNKELSELTYLLGLDINSPDISGLTYGSIRLMADADFDGSAIKCLLLQYFSRWPQLFHEGRIQFVNTPIYIAKKGSDERWYYTVADYQADAGKLKGYEVKYYKGLGTLGKHEYKKIISNPNLTVVQWDETQSLDMAFGDSADARKEWMLG